MCGMRETAIPSAPRWPERVCRAHPSSTPTTWHKRSTDEPTPASHTDLPDVSVCLFLSLGRLLGAQPYLTLAGLRGSR